MICAFSGLSGRAGRRAGWRPLPVGRRSSRSAPGEDALGLALRSRRSGTACRAPCCSRSASIRKRARRSIEQLAQVDLGDEDAPVAPQDVLGVGRERVEVAQVGVRDRSALRLQPLDGAADRAVRGAPAEEQEVARVRARTPRAAGCRRRCRRPFLAQELHPVVVVGVVADVARDVGLLEAADAVLEARRARDGPRPGERLGVARVRPERAVALVGVVDRDVGQVGERPGSSTARRRWRGTRRTGRRPGSCT